MKPRIGIIPGDPSGIGPELIAKLLSDEGVKGQADILLIGFGFFFERFPIIRKFFRYRE